MAEKKQYAPNPNCVKCGGTGRYDDWSETTDGNWFCVDTTCGCHGWR